MRETVTNRQLAITYGPVNDTNFQWLSSEHGNWRGELSTFKTSWQRDLHAVPGVKHWMYKDVIDETCRHFYS